MTGIRMTVAKASEADIQAALKVAAVMNELENGWWPQCLDADDGSDRFDADNAEHCSSALNYLFSITSETSLFRVAFGMATLLSPLNRLVDPDSDSLQHHPRFTLMAREARTLIAKLKGMAVHASHYEALERALGAVDAPRDTEPPAPAPGSTELGLIENSDSAGVPSFTELAATRVVASPLASNREYHQKRAEQLRERAAELKAQGGDEAEEHAHELEDEASQIEHDLALESMEEGSHG